MNIMNHKTTLVAALTAAACLLLASPLVEWSWPWSVKAPDEEGVWTLSGSLFSSTNGASAWGLFSPEADDGDDSTARMLGRRGGNNNKKKGTTNRGSDDSDDGGKSKGKRVNGNAKAKGSKVKQWQQSERQSSERQEQKLFL